MEEIIIYTVKISRISEYRYFEIPLPKDGVFITGLWYSIRLLDNATRGGIVLSLPARTTYAPQVIVGELSLSSNGKEGVFFYGNLILENTNAGYLDYTSGIFPAKTYNRNPVHQPLKVKIDAKTTIVNGFIHDLWGILSARNINYEIDIYLFVKREINESK